MTSIQQKEFMDFITLLDENGLLSHVVLVGSWAEYLYQHGNVLDGFISAAKTLDIDFLIRNQHRPTPMVDVVSLASKNGYTVDFDYMEGTTKLYTPQNLEIEFLIPQYGVGDARVIPTNLCIKAQALRHMDILLTHTMTVSFHGMEILVPRPEAYVVHKIVINPSRKNKQEKDRGAIRNLWPFLHKETLQTITNGLTKKEQTTFRQITSEMELEI